MRNAETTARSEYRSEPLEVLLDRTLAERLAQNPGVMEQRRYFEVPDKLVMFYKYSYGLQSRFFREVKERARLLGTCCPSCHMVYFPPRAHCNDCYERTRWRAVSHEGEVVSSTTCWYTTSEFFHEVPYAIGYVRPLDADTAMLQRIALGGGDIVEPGTHVTAKFRPIRKGTVADFWYEVTPHRGTAPPQVARRGPPRGVPQD